MASDFAHRVHRLFGLILFLFVALVGWQSYWHLYMSDWLLAQPTNRRLARAERNIPRGAIVDRAGTRLAWTQEGKRQYANSRATAAVLGYIDPVYGRTGVEGEWDMELAGLSRTFSTQDLDRLLRHEKPRGNDLQVTLDLDLQQAALDALGSRRGAVVMLDPATGGILALATAPTFDASTFRADYEGLRTGSDGALRHRATQDRYPPGSTMKVVTAAAALMHDVDPETRYTCHGKTDLDGVTITDFHSEAHGRVDMARALAYSCNFYFASTAVNMKQRDFVETAEAFGFGQRWWKQLDDPRILPVSLVQSMLAEDPSRHIPLGEMAQMGFGQATVVATPLQMAMVSAAIANDGTLMAPYLVSAVRKGGTEHTLKAFHSKAIGFPMDRERAGLLADMMHRVVARGTATGARVSGLKVFGKTGTAQQTGGEDHAWFMGFAEREHKGDTQRVAFAVVLERGGTGGRVAVPVARQVLQAWAKK